MDKNLEVVEALDMKFEVSDGLFETSGGLFEASDGFLNLLHTTLLIS